MPEGECAQRHAQVAAAQGQGASERHLDGGNQGRGQCLTKDRADLLAFYDFPAEHWKHIRTTNPMIRTEPTVRHRTTKTIGCLSRQTALAVTHQMMLSAKKKWRKLDGQNRLPEMIEGVEFCDGIKPESKAA